MTEKLNKNRLLSGLLAVLLAIMIAVPAVLQGPAEAASKKAPTRPVLVSVKVTKDSAAITWKKSKYATSYRVYYRQAGTKKWITLATVSSLRFLPSLLAYSTLTNSIFSSGLSKKAQHIIV